MRRFLALAATIGVAACSADTNGDTRRGGAGASCLTTDDCLSPLECVVQVCVDRSQDALVITLDAVEFNDTAGDAAQFSDNDASFEDAIDVALSEDVDVPGDVVDVAVQDIQPPALDVPPLPADPGPQPDTPSDVLNPVGDCDGLGVAPEWVGAFEGAVDYDLGAPIPGLIEKDILPVEGSLSFSIECIEKKLVVIGVLNGVALDVNPFTMTLKGGYNPSTKMLTAKMVDAQVVIFGIVTVYFEGDFVGALGTDESFQGTWGGDATGNSVNFASLVAAGAGTWDATPQ